MVCISWLIVYGDRNRWHWHFDRRRPLSRGIYVGISKVRRIKRVFTASRRAFFPHRVDPGVLKTLSLAEHMHTLPDIGLSCLSFTNVFILYAKNNSFLWNIAIAVMGWWEWWGLCYDGEVMRSAGFLDISGLWIIKISDCQECLHCCWVH